MEFFSLDPKPSFIDLFMYYFCHVGILTGPYFKYRTFYDWLNSRYCGKVNPTKLILNRSKSLPIILIVHSILSKYASFKVISSAINIYIYIYLGGSLSLQNSVSLEFILLDMIRSYLFDQFFDFSKKHLFIKAYNENKGQQAKYNLENIFYK